MILVVEDSPDDAGLILQVLEHSRVGPIAITRDGGEAIAYLFAAAAPLPRLVLLDVNLPTVKGFEVLRRIRGSPRTHRVPVVVFTSSLHPHAVARSYDLGANSFVIKPSAPGPFAEVLRAIARYWLGLNQVAAEEQPDGRLH
jgi:CheY-like chemotaxis protein